MPAHRPLVDVEALLVAHLDDDVALSALVADNDVASELPSDFPPEGRPFVQVFRASATTVDPETGHIERVVVQVNGYGATKANAWDVIAETYRSILEATGTHAAGVVTATVRLTGPTWSPDPITDAARYTSSFAVTVHPTT